MATNSVLTVYVFNGKLVDLSKVKFQGMEKVQGLVYVNVFLMCICCCIVPLRNKANFQSAGYSTCTWKIPKRLSVKVVDIYLAALSTTINLHFGE